MNRLAMVSLCLLSTSVMFACGEEQEQLSSPVQELEAASEIAPLCTTNQVPTLSGPSSAVTRSGVYSSSYEAWQAFDSNSSNMWISAEFQPAWIAFNFGSTRNITSYAINFNNGSLTSRAPRDWSLQGWSGSSWINVDTRSAQTGWLGVERRVYSVAAPGNYSQYRLYVTDDNDSRAGVVVISMTRLELMGCTPSTCNFNDVCEPGRGETSVNCPNDCYCGDGICEARERTTCREDCGGPPCRIPPCDPI